METIKGSRLIAISATLLVISAILVKGQIRTPCTISMINSFTPCFNFITGSSNNGSSPTSDCCSALQSLTSTSVDCACLVLTANVPVLPINRTLALSLPQACNMAVPVQCKASSAPLPAPGTVSLGPSPSPIAASPLSPRGPISHVPSPSPIAASPLSPRGPISHVPSPSHIAASPPSSPQASKAVALAPAPQSDTTLQLTPASPPVETKAPTTNPGIRPVLTPPASDSSYVSPAPLLALVVGIMVF